MSAQATDKQVNIVNRNFFNFLITPEDGVKMDVDYIKEFINSISFFNNKAVNIKKTCNILVDEYNSQVPRTIEELTKLPGVGIKTAKVFLAVIEDAPYIGVDTHVHRVLNRLGLVNTKSPLETDKKISKGFTKENHGMLHNTLVLFGRYHCIARKPKCETCPFIEKCKHYKKVISKS
jgi:endonuclease-3